MNRATLTILDPTTGVYVNVGSVEQLTTCPTGEMPILRLENVRLDWVEIFKLYARMVGEPPQGTDIQ